MRLNRNRVARASSVWVLLAAALPLVIVLAMVVRRRRLTSPSVPLDAPPEPIRPAIGWPTPAPDPSAMSRRPAHTTSWAARGRPAGIAGVVVVGLALVGVFVALQAQSSDVLVNHRRAPYVAAPAPIVSSAPTVPADLSVPGAPSVSLPAEPSDDSLPPLPPLYDLPPYTGGPIDGVPAVSGAGIPSTALDAYQRAAGRWGARCNLPWALLAAIGRVESNHGQFGDSVLYGNGESSPPVIGIALTGQGTTPVRDTDRGRLDGDSVWDHAVGPMQFIPSTWQAYATDGNGDGRADPFNIYDAAAAAARYLCAAGGDLSTRAGQTPAILSYNPSDSYLSTVLAYEAAYQTGGPLVFPATAPTAPPAHRTRPPVDAGPPLAGPPVRRTTPASSPSRPPSRTPSSSPASSPGSSPPTSASSSSSPTSTPASGSSSSSSSSGSPSTSASSSSSSPSPSCPTTSSSASPTTTSASTTPTATPTTTSPTPSPSTTSPTATSTSPSPTVTC